MVRPGKDVTDAELEIMRVLWELDSCTIRTVVDELYDSPTRNNYQTVRKLMTRLEEKRFVRRRKSGTAHIFRALVQQNDLIERRIDEVVNSLCDGSSLPLLTCLLQGNRLSAGERKRLHELFQKLTGKTRS